MISVALRWNGQAPVVARDRIYPALKAPGWVPSVADRAGSSQTGDVQSAIAALAGARRGPVPETIEPQLASVASLVPEGEEWLHEIKLDGYRLLAHFDQGQIRLRTRHGLDWTQRFSSLARTLSQIPIHQAILDGEVVVLDAKGISNFQALQNALQTLPDRRGEMVYFAFDLLYVDGWDLREVSLEQRKSILRQLIPSDGKGLAALRFSDHVVGNGPASREQACRMGLEGIICKRRDAPYRSGRTTTWLKAKCAARQEFVIGGYTEPAGSREHFGALLLGLYDGGQLRFVGRCGSGFSEASLRDLHRTLHPLEQPRPAFHDPPRGADARGVHWLRPELVAEVSFTGFTDDGRARHAIFQGLREDKPASEVRWEMKAQSPNAEVHPAVPRPGTEHTASRARQEPSKESRPSSPPLSHPDRVLYPDQGLTKRDLADYYSAVADRLLPHTASRALTLVRCPEGQQKACFYQKHVGRGLPPHLLSVPLKVEGGEALHVAFEDVEGLWALVQMGVLEIHVWGSRTDQPAAPDRLIFDLDPDGEVDWPKVVEGAREIRERLQQLGLQSFVKSTGGKGLHVVLPVRRDERRLDWDKAKAFCHALAKTMEKDSPTRYVSTASKAKRKGKIYVDYLRNGWGATAVAPYSTRARAGAPVAVPLAWDELTTFDPGKPFTVATIAERLKLPDPWAGMATVKQQLPAALLKVMEAPAPRRSR